LSQLAAAGWIDPRTLQTSASSTKKPTKKNKKSTSNGSSPETPQEMGPVDDGTRAPIEDPVREAPVARRDETNLPAEPQNPPIELGDVRPIPRRPVGDPTGADSPPVVADPPPIAMPTDPPVAAQIELPAIPPSHTRPVTGGDATNDAPARRIELADRPLTPPANLPAEIGLPVGGAPPIRARVGETGFDPAEAPNQPVLPRDRGVIRERVAEIAPAAPAPRIDLNLVGDAMLPRGDTPSIPRVAQNVPVAITAPVPRIDIETAPGAPAVPTRIDGPPPVLPGNTINPANPVAPTAISAPVRADLGIGSPQQGIPRLDPGGAPITAPTPVPAPTPAPIGSIDITAPIVNPIQVAPPPADLSLGTIADPTVTPSLAPQLPAITAPTLTAPVTGTTSTGITLQNPLLPSADGATAVSVPTPIVGPAPLPTPTEVAPTTATPPSGTTGTKTSPTGSKNTTTVTPAPAPAPGS
jgi:hypothetical protein